jgi:hypothetical protein
MLKCFQRRGDDMQNRIKIADDYLERVDYFGEDFQLICPKCGFDHTHLESVEYFGRHEDDEIGTHATMNINGCKVDDCLDGNPSDRRDGLILHFTCEDGCEFDILIFQHKGGTYFHFKNEIAPPPPKPKTHKEKYHEYLLSEQWVRLRDTKIKDVGNSCQLCSRREGLQVHHRTYDNVFNEKLDDLIVLCKHCHKKFHNKS